MDVRFQVFVSSTFADLKEERRKVIQTLMELDCIPAGMELFPAADEDQMEFIKRVIDDCDYYILIIGGRYGSVSTQGVSYTEEEYDYAVAKGLKVIAFLHEAPEEIPVGKTERDPNAAQKLESFRKKVATGRLVKFWKQAPELPGLVALSLAKTMKLFPAIGWVRANAIASSKALSEAIALRKENDELKAKIAAQSAAFAPIQNLAPLNSIYEMHGVLRRRLAPSEEHWTKKKTWGEIFALLAPRLMDGPSESRVRLIWKGVLFEEKNYEWIRIKEDEFQTIKIQLIGYGLILVKNIRLANGAMELVWTLTRAGEQQMMELRTIKAN